MKISVVTVCFNSAATVAATLESFVAQDYPDKELVIVDGGSTDGTLDIVRSSLRASDGIVISERDAGIYDAMNKGLVAFTGDAVGFLNSDDRFSSAGSLSALAACLKSSDITYGHLQFVSDHHSRRVVRRWHSKPFTRGAFRRGWMPAHPTFYVTRTVVQAVGAFDLRFRIAADYDYMLRAMELHSFRSALVDRVLVDMALGGASTRGMRAYLQSNIEAYRSRRERLNTPRLDPALLAKPLGKISQLVVRSSSSSKNQE